MTKYLMEGVQNKHLGDAKQSSYFKDILHGVSRDSMKKGNESKVDILGTTVNLCVAKSPQLQCLVPGGCMTPTQELADIMTSEVKTPDTNMIERTFFASVQQLNKVDSDYEVKLIDYDDYRSSNHLLKHCLSEGQRTAALEHFGVADIKEAAKMVSKMGQREMQQKFKLVYGTTTHSNNNDWLRKKLYEAIGAAPAKQTLKGISKKAQSRNRKAKAKGPSGIMPDKQRRSRKMSTKLLDSYPSYPGGLPKTPVLKNYVSRSKSLPSTFPFGSSVIDMNAYIASDYFSTSDEDMVSGMISPEADFGSSIRKTSTVGSKSDQTVVGADWRKSSFDSCESLEFSSLHTMPILFADDVTDWDISEADRRKSVMSIDKKHVEQPATTKHLDEDEDILLPVDSSAFNLVDILKEFL